MLWNFCRQDYIAIFARTWISQLNVCKQLAITCFTHVYRFSNIHHNFFALHPKPQLTVQLIWLWTSTNGKLLDWTKPLLSCFFSILLSLADFLKAELEFGCLANRLCSCTPIFFQKTVHWNLMSEFAEAAHFTTNSLFQGDIICYTRPWYVHQK